MIVTVCHKNFTVGGAGDPVRLIKLSDCTPQRAKAVQKSSVPVENMDAVITAVAKMYPIGVAHRQVFRVFYFPIGIAIGRDDTKQACVLVYFHDAVTVDVGDYESFFGGALNIVHLDVSRTIMSEVGLVGSVLIENLNSLVVAVGNV